NGNASIKRIDGGVGIAVRLDRFEIPGRKNAGSNPITLVAARPKQSNRTAGHRDAYGALCEIADGNRKLAQSQVVTRGGKWFLFITVSGPAPAEHASRDAGRVLFIRPGDYDALRIHSNRICGGFGEEAIDRVSRVRASIDARRASWRKSHGDEQVPFAASLSEKWRNQSSAICDALIAEVVRSLESRDFGRVGWMDGNEKKCALALAGKSGDNDRRELFPFEQLRRKAEKRLAEIGIEFVGRANMRSVKRRISVARKRKTVASVEMARKSRESLATQGA